MSTPQRTHARTTLVVDRTTADVLRREAKKILMFGHEPIDDDGMAEITANRNAVAILDRLIGAYSVARARAA